MDVFNEKIMNILEESLNDKPMCKETCMELIKQCMDKAIEDKKLQDALSISYFLLLDNYAKNEQIPNRVASKIYRFCNECGINILDIDGIMPKRDPSTCAKHSYTSRKNRGFFNLGEK